MSNFAPLVPIDPAREVPEDAALLHLLDGYYIKRHTVKPWNTRGGYCDVYKGDHPMFGKVAMKRPRGDECTESQLRNFRREAQIWKGLRHPNILLFVGIIDRPSHIWLISAFAENGSLHEYIRGHQEADHYSLVLQFTSGLEYLHSQTVVHGDLKSDNLLISANHQLLIADFGLSKLPGMATNTSKKGAGSVRWMAPELLDEEDATKTFSTDVYAYGITISEILCGDVPFKQYSTLGGVIKAILQNKRPPTIPQESPQGKSYSTLWAAAEVCWDPTPSKRPSIVDVCIRFSLQYGGIPRGATRDANNNPVSSLAVGTIIHSETTHSVQKMISYVQPGKPITYKSDASDSRLLQLLGNAEHGDVGHMKDDGLCLEGTRIEVLRKLHTWADGNSSPRVMLLKGQAGRGKSTIARSISSRFQKQWGGNASSGIFHFRRNNEALNSRPVLALARQLASSADPWVRTAVLKSVEDHQDVAELRLEEQFEVLLLQPLKGRESNSPRALLVIDALDECSDHSLISSLLHLIHKHAPSLPSTVKFLLTSRPEDYIVRPFNASFDGAQEDLDIVDKTVIDEDIRSFFTTRLSEIQREFGFGGAWVSSDDISKLVLRTQGLFQWAHAAVEYIRERPLPNLRRLVQSPTLILGLPALYQQILSTAFPQRKGVKDDENLVMLIQHVIGSLVVADRPMSPAVLEYLWDHYPDRSSCSDPGMEIREDILGRLGSMLVLPSTPNGPIHFMHISVRDFFTSPAQCDDPRFLITPSTHHSRLTDVCFRRMERDLKHDICNIKDPSKMNSEVLDLVEQHIPLGLRYCCRSWSTHLSEIADDGDAGFHNAQKQLDDFCTQQLLNWLQVLSLIGALSEVFDMTYQTKLWLKKLKSPRSEAGTQTSSLLNDTDDFCRRFFKLMSINAQHINLSYLLQFPDNTSLRSIYSVGQQAPRITRGPGPRRSDRSRAINAKIDVYCVAVSPDGKLIASGSKDGTIRLWDVDTGELKGNPLVRHTGSVRSVAFTLDGNTLASGSFDQSIRLWNVTTGEPKGKPLVGHTSLVMSIAFTPNGSILASGSGDNTIRLWNVATGEPKGKPLVGHNGPIRSVVFAPDGNILASGSNDKTVRLWNITTGELERGSFVGHSDWVWSIAFTPDGNTLASGSSDKTIRLWDVATGGLKRSPLVGHTGSVSSLAFAPDGTVLASGSYDSTIRLWDVATGKPKEKPLTHHTSSVRSIAFAPDGNTLASGSYDKTIQLWNVAPGELEGTPLVGHTNSVASIAFALNGDTLISRSVDETIHWRLGGGAPMRIEGDAHQLYVSDDLQVDPSIRLGGNRYDKHHEQGWVFINKKRCFWLPEDFYMEEGSRQPVRISLFGTLLVLYHRSIHILDVSPFV